MTTTTRWTAHGLAYVRTPSGGIHLADRAGELFVSGCHLPDGTREVEPIQDADLCEHCIEDRSALVPNGEDGACPHGSPVTESGSGPGFTGAPVYWTIYRDGCVDFDGSSDNLGAVR